MSATGAVEVAARPRTDRTRLVSWLFLVLIAILSVELLFCIRRESQTWDEACHIFAGYSYWSRGDFGMNPEHPPLVKLLTTLPLLGLNLRVPEHPKFFSKEEDFTTGTDFLYKNNAEQILLRTRMMAGCLTVLLALVLYCAVRRMFGTGAALIGLFLLVIEPNILAHGMVITTDIGFTCFLFATVYAFYRYVQEPSAGKLVLTGLAAGLALASKHSGILVLPILCLLAACEVLPRKGGCKEERASQSIFRKPGGRLAASVLAIGVIAIITLWAFYGFRSQPRAGINAEAEVIAYAGQLKHPFQTRIISEFTNWHLLPQAYLYGLTDVEVTAEFSHSYILGTIYPHGKWFYFPIAFVIKTTVALMLLLLFVPFLARKHPERRREWIFLSIPPVVYFIVAMSSGMNIGVRHILPVYPFLFALGGWAAWTLMQRSRAWAYAIACLLLFSLISSARAFPVYLAYSNELWGGPASTYKYLSDSNADWGQQLKATKRYLDARHVDHCWFAYFADIVTDPTYYGIPCKPLTTIASVWLQPSIDVPAKIDGPVLISSSVLTGYEFGPGSLNPYEQFLHLQPTAVIEDGIFVFDGNFEIPLAAARNHVTQAQLARHANQMERALSEAQTAATLAPHSVPAQAELGDVLSQLKRTEEAHQAYEKALLLAQTEYPEFQAGWVSGLKQALKEKQ